MENKKDFSWKVINNINSSNQNRYSQNLRNLRGRPKKSDEHKKIKYSLGISPILTKKIKEYSNTTGMTTTSIVEQALIEFFDRKNNL